MALIFLIGYVLISHFGLFFQSPTTKLPSKTNTSKPSPHYVGRLWRKFCSDETLALRRATLEDIFKTLWEPVAWPLKDAKEHQHGLGGVVIWFQLFFLCSRSLTTVAPSSHRLFPHPYWAAGVNRRRVFSRGRTGECPSLHLGHGHGHWMQKDDPSSLTRPEASDAEQEAWESWGRRWGVELGKEEVKRGTKGKGASPKSPSGGGTSPRRGGEPGAEMTEWRWRLQPSSKTRTKNRGGFRLKIELLSFRKWGREDERGGRRRAGAEAAGEPREARRPRGAGETETRKRWAGRWGARVA